MRTQEEIKRLYRESDIFVAPSVIAANGDRDGIPNVLLEAMAMGLPVVGTNVSGLPEVIIDGKTGVLVHECMSAGVQKCISAEVHECRSAGAQKCRSTEVHECMSAGVQKCISAEVHERRSAGAHELADALEKLINNPDLRKELGDNGRQLIAEKFDIEKNIDELIGIFVRHGVVAKSPVESVGLKSLQGY